MGKDRKDEIGKKEVSRKRGKYEGVQLRPLGPVTYHLIDWGGGGDWLMQWRGKRNQRLEISEVLP